MQDLDQLSVGDGALLAEVVQALRRLGDVLDEASVLLLAASDVLLSCRHLTKAYTWQTARFTALSARSREASLAWHRVPIVVVLSIRVHANHFELELALTADRRTSIVHRRTDVEFRLLFL